MVDYSATRAHFDSQKYHYYTFHTKSEKPIKAVIRQLPTNTPAEDIASSLHWTGQKSPRKFSDLQTSVTSQ
jgi:hypothetical protein